MLDHALARTSSALLSLKETFKERRLLLVVCFGLLAGPLACSEGGAGDEAPQAEAGPFEAEVQGAFQQALQGQATARLDSTGHLAGLELDDDADTARAGLSFELAAWPLGESSAAARTYRISPRRAAPGDTASVSLMNAYLRLRSYEFAARAGSLRVRRDSAGLHGTFDLRLRGTVEAASDEPATVTARGRFDRVRPARQ